MGARGEMSSCRMMLRALDAGVFGEEGPVSMTVGELARLIDGPTDVLVGCMRRSKLVAVDGDRVSITWAGHVWVQASAALEGNLAAARSRG